MPYDDEGGGTKIPSYTPTSWRLRDVLDQLRQKRMAPCPIRDDLRERSAKEVFNVQMESLVEQEREFQTHRSDPVAQSRGNRIPGSHQILIPMPDYISKSPEVTFQHHLLEVL